MKFRTGIILLTIVDYGIIWLWVKQMDPDPSITIAILFLVPFVVILNLIIALIFYFAKRELVSLFLSNSVIAGVLVVYLFSAGIDRHQNERIESLSFNIQNKTYEIIHWKLENTFSLSEINGPHSSTGVLDGKLTKKGTGYYLTTDTTEYIIRNGYMYKFRNESDAIKLTKIER